MSQQINRRQLIAAGAGLALAGGSVGSRAADAQKKPNVLFILADDMGYADLSCYGRTDYRTAHLDQLAREGLLMTSGYANSAVCSASRTALATGRYQYRLNVGLYEPGGGGADYGIPDGHPTMPGLFRQLGYRTSLFGKWHLGTPPKYGPLQRGYDHFFGFQGGAADYFRVGGGKGAAGLTGDAALAVGGGCELAGVSTAGGPVPTSDLLYEGDTAVRVPGYLTDLLADRASAEISACAKAGQPFFMSLHFNAPHWPWEGPGDEEASKSIRNIYHADGGSIRKYGEMVVAMDAAIGRVLQALKRNGVDRDTIVVFTSDNGGERFSNSWPFAGAKGELLEGGIRVPLLLRWPRHIRAGSRSDQLAIHMDWLPTLLAAAGGKPDAAYPSDGMNLLPVILGQQSAVPRKLFWRYLAAEQAVVREGDWKYLKLGGREFLFNIKTDERERANRRFEDKARFERLKAEWAAWNATMLPYPAGMRSDSPKLSHCWSDRY